MIKPFLPILLSLPLVLVGCGGGSSSSNQGNTQTVDQSPAATVDVTGKKMEMNVDLSRLRSAGVTADRVVVIITKGEFTRTLELAHVNYAAKAEFSNLTVGNYVISVKIYDADTVVAEGTGLGIVSADEIATVNMSLSLKSGGLVVNISIPEDDSNKTNFSGSLTLATITEKIDGSEHDSIPFLFIPVPIGETANYNNNAAYAQLNKGTNLSLDFSIAYDWNKFPLELMNSNEGANQFTLKVGDSPLFNCTECAFTFGYNSESKAMEFMTTFALQGEESLSSVATGEILDDPFGGSGKMIGTLKDAAVSIVFTPVGEPTIGSVFKKMTNIADLMDSAKYSAQIAVRVKSLVDGNSIIESFHINESKLKAEAAL